MVETGGKRKKTVSPIPLQKQPLEQRETDRWPNRKTNKKWNCRRFPSQKHRHGNVVKEGGDTSEWRKNIKQRRKEQKQELCC